MSRRAALLPIIALLAAPASAAAQATGQISAEQALRDAEVAYGPPAPDEGKECTPPAPGEEIVVCAEWDDPDQFRIPSSTDLGTNTDDGLPRAPDLGPPPCVPGPSTACIRFGNVPPPVYMIDFDELPETPPGSDAERVGQGLAPTGDQGTYVPEELRQSDEEPEGS